MNERYADLDPLVMAEAMIVIEIQGQLATQAFKRAGGSFVTSPDGGEVELPPD